jgi:hypothetical protein
LEIVGRSVSRSGEQREGEIAERMLFASAQGGEGRRGHGKRHLAPVVIMYSSFVAEFLHQRLFYQFLTVRMAFVVQPHLPPSISHSLPEKERE